MQLVVGLPLEMSQPGTLGTVKVDIALQYCAALYWPGGAGVPGRGGAGLGGRLSAQPRLLPGGGLRRGGRCTFIHTSPSIIQKKNSKRSFLGVRLDRGPRLHPGDELE